MAPGRSRRAGSRPLAHFPTCADRERMEMARKRYTGLFAKHFDEILGRPKDEPLLEPMVCQDCLLTMYPDDERWCRLTCKSVEGTEPVPCSAPADVLRHHGLLCLAEADRRGV